MLKIRNMDEICDKFVEKKKYRNKNPLAPQHPFRAVVLGPSGSGKTNVVMNLVMEHLEFDKLYIFAKDLEEEKYLTIIGLAEHMAKEAGIDPIEVIEYHDDPTKVDIGNFDPKKQNLCIFDDMVTESKENQSKIDELFVRGRKTPNCSVMYLTQSYFNTPPLLRKQVNYVIAMNVDNQRELQEISKTYATDIDYKEFKQLYKDCVKQDFGFLVIDMKNKKLKYRCCFDNIYVPKNEEEQEEEYDSDNI